MIFFVLVHFIEKNYQLLYDTFFRNVDFDVKERNNPKGHWVELPTEMSGFEYSSNFINSRTISRPTQVQCIFMRSDQIYNWSRNEMTIELFTGGPRYIKITFYGNEKECYKYKCYESDNVDYRIKTRLSSIRLRDKIVRWIRFEKFIRKVQRNFLERYYSPEGKGTRNLLIKYHDHPYFQRSQLLEDIEKKEQIISQKKEHLKKPGKFDNYLTSVFVIMLLVSGKMCVSQ